MVCRGTEGLGYGLLGIERLKIPFNICRHLKFCQYPFYSVIVAPVRDICATEFHQGPITFKSPGLAEGLPYPADLNCTIVSYLNLYKGRNAIPQACKGLNRI